MRGVPRDVCFSPARAECRGFASGSRARAGVRRRAVEADRVAGPGAAAMVPVGVLSVAAGDGRRVCGADGGCIPGWTVLVDARTAEDRGAGREQGRSFAGASEG